jgi:fibronectin-binding autotransporter adhesin
MKPSLLNRFCLMTTYSLKVTSPATYAAMILCSLPLAATAADVYWDSNSTTAGAGTAPIGNWGTSAFWSSDITGASATTATWNSSDTAVFSAGSDATSPYTVTLNANTAAAGLKFEEGSTVTLNSATVAKNLTVNSNLDLTLGGRWVLFGSSAANAGVNLLLGSNSLTLNNGNIELNGNNTMSSALLKNGVAIAGQANAFGTTGTVTMGDTAANSTVQIRMRSLTLSRAIVLQSGTGFTTNATLNNVGFLSPTVTGGITSTGSGTTNLTIDSIISSTGSSLTFTVSGANPINHTGALTLRNTGTGAGSPTGTLDISAPIGSNVTTVAVSDTSSGVKGLQRVILGNTGNAWTGNTTINALARLELSASDVIPHGSGKGNLTVNGTMDLRTGTGNSTETINGLSGSGTITRSGATDTSTLVVGDNNTSSTFTGSISQTAGTVALTKVGSGTLTLSGTNTYSGGTNVSAGTLSLLTTTAKPSTGTISVAAGATLSFGVTGANPFTAGEVNSLFTNTPLVGVTMNAASLVGIDTTGGDFTFGTSVASTTRGLNKLGSNTLTLTGANAYTGATTLTAGTLSVATIGNGGVASGNMGSASNAATNLVFNGGTLQYTGSTASTDRNFTINTGKTATIEVTTGTNLTMSGGSTSTNGALTKTGAGTLTLTGVNNHTGATNISAGKLVINGNISTSALTTVNSGGTLGGSGSTGALTVLGTGVVAPGNSPGVLTVNGNYTQTAGTLSLELNGTAAGSGYDQLAVNGTVTLGGTLTATLGGGYDPVNGDLLFILDNNNDGDFITTTFSDMADLSTITLGGQDWKISYNANYTGIGPSGGTLLGGNDIALMAVPEPTAALLGSLGLLALLRRRRA